MALVPVFCDHCGTLFATGSFIGGDATGVTFEDCGFGPCPTCGQMGRVLDGTFEFIGDTINVLSAPEWSLEKLGWLQQRIEAAQRGQASPEQVVDEVAAEAPELRALIGNLSRAGWKAIQILVMLLTIVTFRQSQTKPPATKSDLKQATETIMHEIERQPIRPSQQTVQRRQGPGQTATKRKAKPGKSYGRNKKRKRR